MKNFIFVSILFLLFNFSFSINSDEALEILKKSSKSQKQISPVSISKNQVVASILLCSDMNTKINSIFNLKKEKLYTVNVLGNVALEPEIASIEYSLIQLESPLIVVLGHYHCNIISDVLKSEIKENSIQSIKETLNSSIERARLIYGTNYSETLYKQSVVLNVYYSMESIIKQSKIVKDLLSTRKIKIIGAIYNENNNRIEWLGEHPMQQEIIDGTYNSLEFLALYKEKSLSKKEEKEVKVTKDEKPIEKQNNNKIERKEIAKVKEVEVKSTSIDFYKTKPTSSPRNPNYITMVINTFKNATKIKLEVYAINTKNSSKNLVFSLPDLKVINGRAQAQFYFAGRKFRKNFYLPKGNYIIAAEIKVFSSKGLLEAKTVKSKDIITLY